jgi:hypothetical protein
MEAMRRNITRNVTWKLESGELVFYHNENPIGRMKLPQEGIEMVQGYELDQDSIYLTGPGSFHNQYTEDCDMGWCR